MYNLFSPFLLVAHVSAMKIMAGKNVVPCNFPLSFKCILLSHITPIVFPSSVYSYIYHHPSILPLLILSCMTIHTGVDTNFEKLETVGLPTHNFQEPQVKFRSPNFFYKLACSAIEVAGHNIANVEVDF